MVYLLYALIMGIPFVFFAAEAEMYKERKNKELQIQAR